MALIRSLVLAALFAAGCAAAENDTTLLLNGKILTVDAKFSMVHDMNDAVAKQLTLRIFVGEVTIGAD